MASQAVSNPDAEAISVTFDLIDFGRTGEISEAALAQSLLQTGCTHIDTAQARAISANAVRDGNKIDKNVFANVLMEAIDNERASSSAWNPTVGACLVGIVDDLEKFYNQERGDYALAGEARAVSRQLRAREEMTRISSIALRQESEHQGVQEAQMMQAMEFNSAWSQNMTEFERQAREIEETAIRRHQEEFDAFRQKMYNKEARSYKFSRELLNLKASVDANAKQGNYEKANADKRKADELEKWERMKLDNDHKTMIAQKELALRQQQQKLLEARRRRIQRGREEHKEHWLMGAQRLMQSHRNMLSDLKSKQALENMKAEVNVKIDMHAGRAASIREKMRSGYANTLPRVDTGSVKRTPLKGGTTTSKLTSKLGTTS